MNTKPYSRLSKRQQKRRRAKVCSTTKYKILEKSGPSTEGPLRYHTTGLSGPVGYQPSEDFILSPSVSSSSSNTFVEDSDVPIYSVEIDSIEAHESDETLCNKFENWLSVESKIESGIRNWCIDCPNVPNLTVSNLLHHFNAFFPNVVFTAKTLKDEGKLNVTIQTMFCGL